MFDFSERRKAALVCFLLAYGTLLIYWQVKGFEFTTYDDPQYILENPFVKAGLTLKGIAWAFTTGHMANWHPLTWLSHMLDCQFFGLNAGAHHLVNVGFHLLNALLLFHVLRRMTGALWRSAVVAALFAWHPLHVESVAWVAERKDVLSGFFWMLTLWAYVRYAERPGALRYALVLLFFATGLLAKPMLVTLPFVLLLLDYWPLRRLQLAPAPSGTAPDSSPGSEPATLDRAFRLLLEKLPLLVLSIASSVITFIMQAKGGTIKLPETFSWTMRLTNAVVSCARYLGKMICPEGLAVFYPPPAYWMAWQVVGAVLLLVLVTLLAVALARAHPWLPVGWLWFLGTLIPVIGLVQVGSQAMADRYTYIPLIGIFMIVTWAMARLASRWPFRGLALGSAGALVLGGCLFASAHQIRHWRNSVTLFTHALAVTSYNAMAHNNLGVALSEQRQVPEAIEHFAEAIRIAPDFGLAHNNLGLLLLQTGKLQEATEHLGAAIRLLPDNPTPYQHLARVFLLQGQTRESIACYWEALRLQPDSSEALNNLASILASNPKPEFRNGTDAVRLALRANQLVSFKNATFASTLAAAYAEAGQFNQAVAAAQKALDLATASNEKAVAALSRKMLALFQAGQPYRE